MMEKATYEAWWALHLRVARGERLTVEEQVTYEAGRGQLHHGVSLDGGPGQLRAARAAVQTLEAEHNRLLARQHQLNAEIAALEAVLDKGTLENLALKD